jgi:regulator of chromosome condensation
VIEKQNEPMLISGLERITQISVGNNFCLALDVNGKVYSWGRSEQNQLGRRVVADRHHSAHQAKASDLHNDAGLSPGLVALPPRRRIISIHAGSDHAFAIDSNGDTWAWGLNNFGQTGIKRGAGRSGSTIIVPQKVTSLAGKNMRMIQGGTHHSIGITQTGECLAWGRMDGAQMGLDVSTLPVDDPKKITSERGKPRILLEPTALPHPGCVYVAAGSDHNLMITSDGKAYSWGFNANYQCGQGPDTDDISVATLIDNSAVRNKKLSWAGAGGQYSMLASPHGHADNGAEPLTNGALDA